MPMKNNHRAEQLLKWLTRLSVVLMAVEVITVFLSWIVTAAMPWLPVRSVLSSEGIRWFFGRFVDNMLSPVFLWLILGAMAYAVWRDSQFSFRCTNYRQRFALQLAVAEALVVVVVMMLLTLMPQAILLSPSGSLFPSSASDSFVPLCCATAFLMASTYGMASGRFAGLTDVMLSLAKGTQLLLPLLFVYMLCCQLAASIHFIFFP